MPLGFVELLTLYVDRNSKQCSDESSESNDCPEPWDFLHLTLQKHPSLKWLLNEKYFWQLEQGYEFHLNMVEKIRARNEYSIQNEYDIKQMMAGKLTS